VSRKTAVTEWIDRRLTADRPRALEVHEILDAMRLEQDLAALREKRKLTQREVAKLIGTSQPYVAKLESGQIKNMGVGTLVKYAQALGGTIRSGLRCSVCRSSHAGPAACNRYQLMADLDSGE
jgi:transcriptional regulator with XRE-family HTH domain